MEKGNQERIKRIVLIGAESTGKTELAEYLSKKFDTVWVPEYARDYIEQLDRIYTFEDVEHIAREQVLLEEKYSNNANKVLFYDTYLIITKIWFKVVYNKVPDWIHQKLNKSNIDLFLLCNNDIPWVADSVRENGGAMRDKLYHIYEQELKEYNFNYSIITGSGDERRNNAVKIINKLLE